MPRQKSLDEQAIEFLLRHVQRHGDNPANRVASSLLGKYDEVEKEREAKEKPLPTIDPETGQPYSGVDGITGEPLEVPVAAIDPETGEPYAVAAVPEGAHYDHFHYAAQVDPASGDVALDTKGEPVVFPIPAGTDTIDGGASSTIETSAKPVPAADEPTP